MRLLSYLYVFVLVMVSSLTVAAPAPKYYEINEADIKAAKDNPKNQYSLSLKYWNRHAVKGVGHQVDDIVQSFSWMKKAADGGYLPAFQALGEKYKIGRGIGIDLKLANFWYTRWGIEAEKRAVNGDRDYQYHMGRVYHAGANGKSKDISKAIYWYKKAALQGDITSLNRLGGFYIDGHVVKRDLNKAEYYFKKSAELGDALAKTNLAIVRNQIVKHKLWKEGKQNENSITISRSHFAPELAIIYSPYCTLCNKNFHKHMPWLKGQIEQGKLTVHIINSHWEWLKKKSVKKDISNLFYCISEEKDNLEFLNALTDYSSFIVAHHEEYKSLQHVSGPLANKAYQVVRAKHPEVSEGCLAKDITGKKEAIRQALQASKIDNVPMYLYAGKKLGSDFKGFKMRYQRANK